MKFDKVHINFLLVGLIKDDRQNVSIDDIVLNFDLKKLIDADKCLVVDYFFSIKEIKRMVESCLCLLDHLFHSFGWIFFEVFLYCISSVLMQFCRVILSKKLFQWNVNNILKLFFWFFALCKDCLCWSVNNFILPKTSSMADCYESIFFVLDEVYVDFVWLVTNLSRLNFWGHGQRISHLLVWPID